MDKRGTKRREPVSWTFYIYMILKQLHPYFGISNMAMANMRGMVWYLIQLITQTAHELTTILGKKTITSSEIQTAVRLHFTGELAIHAVFEGTKAATKYANNIIPEGGNSRLTRSQRAGLTIPVKRVATEMKKLTKYRIGVGAAVNMCAVIEYTTAEVIDLAGNISREKNRVQIVSRHIMLAIRTDEELNNLFAKCIIVGGGVVPFIQSALLPESELQANEPNEGQEKGAP